MKNLYHSGRKNPIDPQPVLKTLVILTENRVLKFLQHSLNVIFLLQSQIVYYCFVDFVTKENLTSLLMYGLNQYELLKRITIYTTYVDFVIFTMKIF